MDQFEPPINWSDHEDIALKLYECFGDEFNEGKIYRVRFTDLLEWVLQVPQFEDTREQSTEGRLEMIQSAWVYEWRDNQKWLGNFLNHKIYYSDQQVDICS